MSQFDPCGWFRQCLPASEDCETYRRFLTNPTPAERWCALRGRQEWSALCRPFEGPLSASATAHASVACMLPTMLQQKPCRAMVEAISVDTNWFQLVEQAGAHNSFTRSGARDC